MLPTGIAKKGQSTWNNVFQDSEHHSKKESDPWDIGYKWGESSDCPGILPREKCLSHNAGSRNPEIYIQLKYLLKTKMKWRLFWNLKAERIHHQLVHSTRNVKGNSTDRRKMTLDEKTDLHREMKITRYGNYVGKYTRFKKIKYL